MSGPSTVAQPDAGATRGLRERSKLKRRAHIRRVAMQLFARNGYDATTIADIADAAEVAPRTVSGYFPSKVDIATSFADEVAGRLTAAFADNENGDVLEVLGTWLAGEAELLDPGLASLATAMYEANPELGAISSAHVTEAASVGGAAIAAELDLPAEHPMVAVCNAAIGAALGSYLGATSHVPASPELHRSMTAFLRGLIDAARTDSG